MTEDNISFSVEDVERKRGDIFVTLEGMSTPVTPEFVIKTRARLKALRIVGVESVAREFWDDIVDGDVNRATDIAEINQVGSERGRTVWRVVVVVFAE